MIDSADEEAHNAAKAASERMIENFELPVSLEEMVACGIGEEGICAFTREFQTLHSIGFPLEDIADAFYSDLRFSTAVGNADHLKATKIIAASMAANLTVIENSRIKEDRLWRLTEEGLAVGEISWAIRNIDGFSQKLLALPAEELGTYAKLTYEFFRQKGRLTRRTARTKRRKGKSWFAHYSGIVRNCGVGPENMPASLASASVFGSLADPNYDMGEELRKDTLAQAEEIKQRMSSIDSDGAKGAEGQVPMWLVYIVLIIGVIAIVNLLSNH